MFGMAWQAKRSCRKSVLYPEYAMCAGKERNHGTTLRGQGLGFQGLGLLRVLGWQAAFV